MGHGIYSASVALSRNYAHAVNDSSNSEIFKQKRIDNTMNPRGVKIREARDNEDHPTSFPIVMGLDVTGSMGSVPNFLVKEGLPKIMEKIYKGGQKDPQILFVAIGDHECDESPLQVGQFESNDEALDKWLKSVYLEGGGGGNSGESYLLAWYFAAFHTATDHFQKRNKKGIVVTIGDEPTLKTLSAYRINELMGTTYQENFNVRSLLEKAQETYDVYHIHVLETMTGQKKGTVEDWKNLLGQNLLVANTSKDIADILSKIVLNKSELGNTLNESATISIETESYL